MFLKLKHLFFIIFLSYMFTVVLKNQKQFFFYEIKFENIFND